MKVLVLLHIFYLRGLAEFYHQILSRTKLNANIEQIEGKLYFNIRGEILIEVLMRPHINYTSFKKQYMLCMNTQYVRPQHKLLTDPV